MSGLKTGLMRGLMLVLLCVLPGLLSAAEKAVPVPGTPVNLVPPKGFTPTKAFSGFANEETGGSVLVTVMPGPAGQAFMDIYNDQARFADRIKKTGLEVTGKLESKTADNRKITIYTGKQEAHGKNFLRWVMATSDDNGLYMVTVQSPEDADLNENDVLNIYKSVTIGEPQSNHEKVAALPFSFKEEKPFVVFTTLVGNAAIMIPDNAKEPAPDVPSIIIIRDMDPFANTDPKGVEQRYLKTIENEVTIEKTLEEKKVNFAGQDGRFTRFEAKNKNGTMVEVALYSAPLSDGRGIYLHAKANPGELEPYLDSIKKIAESVKIK